MRVGRRHWPWALLLLVGCLAPPEPPALPASYLARLGAFAGAPEVVGVWFGGGGDTALDVVVRFSHPMDAARVLDALTVVAATAPVRGPSDGVPLAVAAEPAWNPSTTEVHLRYTGAGEGAAVVLVIAPTATDARGTPLDGAAPARPATDPVSYHRTEDDGFVGPATYVSLPYYPGGSAALAGHPSFLLSEARPAIACSDGVREVTAGTLAPVGLWRCRLLDRRRAPSRPGVVERRGPRAWDPERLPRAWGVRGDGSRVAAAVAAGADGAVPTGTYTIAAFVGDTGVRLAGLALTAGVDLTEVYLADPAAPEPLWPVTGVTPPDLLWVADVLARATGRGSLTITADDVAWLADEFAGQRFDDGFGRTATIVGNAAASLELAAPINCSPCDFTIRTRVGGRWRAGQRVRLVVARFQVRLDEGDFVALELEPGYDLFGLRSVDGERDGDETTGRPDDVVRFELER